MNSRLPTFFLALVASAHADTVGHWNFDDVGAAAGSNITATVNIAEPGTIDAAPSGGTPLYSDDVPAAEIFDPNIPDAFGMKV